MEHNKVIGIQKIGAQWGMEDPFLFCAHHDDQFPKGNDQMGPSTSLAGRNIGSDFSDKDGFSMYHGDTVPGFPAHPHRGFETVTIVLKGLIDHFDSLGGEGRYGNGDVQWMTAGSGCQHAEMFPLVHADQDNPLELFQVWLNLPAKSKMVAPSYQMHWSEDIPIIEQTDPSGKKTRIRLIAGKLGDHKALTPCPDSWAADPQNKVGIFLLHLEPGAVFTLPAGSPTLHRNLYFYRGTGTLQVEGVEVPSEHRIKVSGKETIQLLNGASESYLAILEGEPIAEPIAQYGPFVMNTQHEIRAAISDFQRTGFGGWPWKEADIVHNRSTGRFARYIDGRVEERGA